MSKDIAIKELKSKIKSKDETIDHYHEVIVDLFKKQWELEQKLWEKENEENLEDYMDEEVVLGTAEFRYKNKYWHQGYMTPKEKRAKERKEKGITTLPVPLYKHPEYGWTEYS